MLNQIILVGRLTRNVEIQTLESGKKVAYVEVAIPRPYKNSEGVYDTDFIKCTLWDSVATRTAEYCRKGDIIGVKGRLESEPNRTMVVAEKITFLSSRKEDER